jgi:hypothetical protein
MSTGLMRLISKLDSNEVKQRIQPADYFKKCPSCGGEELQAVGPDLICIDCCWDSTAWDVRRGAMDNVFIAAKEFGFATLNTVSSATPELESYEEKYFTEFKGA